MSQRARKDVDRPHRCDDAALRSLSRSSPRGREESGNDRRRIGCSGGRDCGGGCRSASVVESAGQGEKQNVTVVNPTHKKQYRPWKIGGIFGSLSGFVVAAMAMLAAWDHNPQGTIHSESGIDWVYWLSLGFSWFVIVCAVVSLIVGGLVAVLARLRERFTRNSRCNALR